MGGTETCSSRTTASRLSDGRHTCTGIERNTRWKSGGAAGTKDSAEVSQLSGKLANAELAAKERVNAV